MRIGQKTHSQIKANTAFAGTTLENELKAYLQQGQTMDDVKRMHEPIYTKRKDGVMPEYNIRTNRWEIAEQAMDKVNKAKKEKAEMQSKKRNAQVTAKTEGIAGGGKKDETSSATAVEPATSPAE